MSLSFQSDVENTALERNEPSIVKAEASRFQSDRRSIDVHCFSRSRASLNCHTISRRVYGRSPHQKNTEYQTPANYSAIPIYKHSFETKIHQPSTKERRKNSSSQAIFTQKVRACPPLFRKHRRPIRGEKKKNGKRERERKNTREW